MAYTFIGKWGVFLPDEKFLKLRRDLAGSAVEYGLSMFEGKKARQLDTKIVEYLKELSVKDPNRFYEEWVTIRLHGKSAQMNTFWIISDYISHCGGALLKDFRDITGQILDSYTGAEFECPLGSYFGIEIGGGSRLPGFRKQRVVIHIDIHRVSKIVGVFPLFRVYTRDFDIQFDDEISIMPPEAKEGGEL